MATWVIWRPTRHNGHPASEAAFPALGEKPSTIALFRESHQKS